MAARDPCGRGEQVKPTAGKLPFQIGRVREQRNARDTRTPFSFPIPQWVPRVGALPVYHPKILLRIICFATYLFYFFLAINLSLALSFSFEGNTLGVELNGTMAKMYAPILKVFVSAVCSAV